MSSITRMLLAAFFFTVQIYCDFSGYSDIARGCAKLFGIDLMENFRSPYFSASVREFWSRWHISLSTWFRDYVYIPLGGNRCGRVRHCVNLLLTFIVSGLWHGANWTFLAWGALHGLAQIVENIFVPKGCESRGVMRAVRVVITFVFVMMAWVLFRANSLGEAWYVFANLFTGISDVKSYLITESYKVFTASRYGKKTVILCIFMLAMWDYYSLWQDNIAAISRRNVFLRRAVYVLFIMLILVFIPLDMTQEFIYFQF